MTISSSYLSVHLSATVPNEDDIDQGEVLYYRSIPKSISDTKKPKDTFIGAYTLEKYEGLLWLQKLMVSISNPKVSA
jgi:hypothetical protein